MLLTFSPRNYDDLVRLSEIIREMAQIKEQPTVGIICGSGLGDLAETVTDKTIIPYSKIPGFPRTSGEPRSELCGL